MKLFGSKQQLCVGGWVLAALTLAGINGFGFVSLESKPLPGSSVAISSLRQKMALLESRLADKVMNAFGQDGKQEIPFSLLTAQRSVGPPGESGPDSFLAEKIQLPDLTGILKVESPSGSTRYLAVLSGRVCREEDEVMAFFVDKISSEGVVLRRQGGKWFIECPQPRYSSDQGE